MISETDKDMDFIVSVFKLKLLCLLGFKPRIEECVNCGAKEELLYFSIKDNGVKCLKCKKQDKGAIAITQSTYMALKYIIEAPSKKLFNLDRKSTRLNSSHPTTSRMPSSA